LTDFEKSVRSLLNNDGPAVVTSETSLRKNVLDNRVRRDVMGDKGGKKGKEKSQKQHDEKQKQKSKEKLDKQPKRRP